jgi:S1-C subfamily serine protease
VEDAEEVWVAFADGESYQADVVGEDPSSDLAVLHVEVPSLPQPIGLADSDELRVGQFVVAIGNPFGLERTLTYGVISSLGRVIESPDGRYIGEAIQTDAAIWISKGG